MNLRRLTLVLAALLCRSAELARLWRACLLPLAFLCVFSRPALAEEVIEAYRSPFGTPRSVSVNPTDGSVWAATGASIMHLAADGAILSQTNGFWEPCSVSVNPFDGSCWVADSRTSKVIHLNEHGAELSRTGGFASPVCVSVNHVDGSCWVADRGTYDFDLYRYFGSAVVHLGGDGSELWRGEDFNGPWSVSVNPSDGSCWVADTDNGHLVHLASDGTELPGVPAGTPIAVAVNPRDGSCWVAMTGGIAHFDSSGNLLWQGGPGWASCLAVDSDDSCWASVVASGLSSILHLAADGSLLDQYHSVINPRSIALDTDARSYWVADSGNYRIAEFATDGTQLWEGMKFAQVISLSVSPNDSVCWLADPLMGAVVRLAPDGEELWRSAELPQPTAVSVDVADGSCWIGDIAAKQISHIASNGAEMASAALPSELVLNDLALAANLSDGSCWVAAPDIYGSADVVLHLAADGTELWQSQPSQFYRPRALALNPSDGSCWVADTGHGQMLHLAADGTELWRGDGFWVSSASLYPGDGSVWLAEEVLGGVIRLAPDGTVIWRREEGFNGPTCVSVNTGDGSAWVAEARASQVVHLAADGTELWRGGGFDDPCSVSVNPANGSCWVGDRGNGQVVHLVIVGYPRFPDVPSDHWAFEQISVCFNAAIISGYPDGLYRPDWPVTRDQMAVFISRALAGGDENVPPGPGIPSFRDVPPSHWAYDYIEYAKARAIVEGHLYGFFLPDLSVSRAQMAVFIARAIAEPTGEEGLANYQPPDTPTFTDVPTDYWCYKHIEYLAENEVVTGYADGAYRPTSTVTRDQTAVHITRAFDLGT